MRTITSLNIKNLSIALEALSRINGQSSMMYSIEQLLQQEIDLAKEQYPTEAPPQAKTTDDDMSF